MMRLSISEYLALVKNLRGIVYFEDGGELLNWVRNRFKYRSLGIPASLKPFIKVKKPFVLVDYPFDSLLKLRDIAGKVLKADLTFIDSLILASCFVSPLLLIGKEAVDKVVNYAVSVVNTRLDMRIQDWKLHLRIADYSILDLYTWCTSHSGKLWEGYDLSNFVNERKEVIEKDERRYWRLEKGRGKERPFLAYLDLVQYLINDLDGLLELPKEETVLALAIVPAVVITEENIPKV